MDLSSVDSLLKDAGGLFRLGCSFGVLLLGDGHLSESVEGGKHRATNPCSVLSVQGSSDDNLSLCIILRQVAKLIFESLWEVSHESSTASQHNVIVKVNFQI